MLGVAGLMLWRQALPSAKDTPQDNEHDVSVHLPSLVHGLEKKLSFFFACTS